MTSFWNLKDGHFEGPGTWTDVFWRFHDVNLPMVTSFESLSPFGPRGSQSDDPPIPPFSAPKGSYELLEPDLTQATPAPYKPWPQKATPGASKNRKHIKIETYLYLDPPMYLRKWNMTP